MSTQPTTKARVWIDEGGLVACDKHGGRYLAAAIAAHPRKREHITPRSHWIRYDEGDIPCETCYPMHIG
ncbi:hypothetical protein [Gordonia sp. (in: high G+C Gram-positive bacteria)]|uniref:hypothetical protein n=1 Tax=Gordonia sp. (in: high G+C Gram-positive bacteria) TaxID=84139 RepID=UPI003C74BFCA